MPLKTSTQQGVKSLNSKSQDTSIRQTQTTKTYNGMMLRLAPLTRDRT